jgi:GTPase SAR1 family protein
LVKRSVHVVNLDPAAESFAYPVSVDIRELISLKDVVEEMGYGPNGGLLFCMEYLASNLQWLSEQLDDFEDDYLLIDCPGQIELYTHLPAMRTILKGLQKAGYSVCGVHLIDSLIVSDATKYISGTLMCLAAMFSLELPHINVMTKCDLVKDKKSLEKLADPDPSSLMAGLEKNTTGKYKSLNLAMGELIEDFGMVGFKLLDPTDKWSIDYVLSSIDQCIQYGEDAEPVDPDRLDRDREGVQGNLDAMKDAAGTP